MVLEFSSKYPLTDYCYQFNASVISDYPEENERIIGFMYCRIRMIYSEMFNLKHDNNLLSNSNMNWYYFSIQLFIKGIYSMSAQIEPFLIQILDNTLQFISKHNIKTIKQFNIKSKTKIKITNIRIYQVY